MLFPIVLVEFSRNVWSEILTIILTFTSDSVNKSPVVPRLFSVKQVGKTVPNSARCEFVHMFASNLFCLHFRDPLIFAQLSIMALRVKFRSFV